MNWATARVDLTPPLCANTKADMVGKSLKMAMEQFKADLIETVKPIHNETVSEIRQSEIKGQTAALDGK